MSAYINLSKRVNELERRVAELERFITTASNEEMPVSETRQQSVESRVAQAPCDACCETSVESS